MGHLVKALLYGTFAITGASFVPSAVAEVVDSSKQGFTIEFKQAINASVVDVYSGLTENVGEWWLDDHTWFGNGQNMQLDARAGGCFCEIFGDSQAQHLQVAMIIPNQLVRLLGGLGPLQGEGVSGVMEWRLNNLAETSTELTVFYRVGGYTPNDLSQWAPAVESVLQQQMAAMKTFVENDLGAR
ncbi:polyketide cyclase/dehydrase [Pseudidiomarina tainanensis]|jgi:hypothetical protein|uniref:Polyketide cyclase/dehydrase/lipid transport protein n=2 Tax=Pseudidiomarina TaxID=2800384 RepID=A0A1I6GE16_9GAMM|nr:MULTISPECIES: hypothetical protein [Pseudidiomarina]RZQ56806.1 polyketide cyclase/dehydrase [Pseudidiomarina tainanensis]SFR40380.1 hypothetical protein SAMN04488070_0542 [Pseudidiomarina maritima]